MNLYLIRHAELESKYLGRYIGSTDARLSSKGKEQAKKLARFLKDVPLDAIYVSQLKRAKQTADPISQQRNIHLKTDLRLAEIDFGP